MCIIECCINQPVITVSGMRGSTPLDVAAASCIDNNELALALQEQDLEMVRQPKVQM